MDELPGRPIWIELFVPDPDAAQAFDGDLSGWTSEDNAPAWFELLTTAYDASIPASFADPQGIRLKVMGPNRG